MMITSNMMIQARKNLDLIQDSVYFVFHDELAKIRRFQGDFLDCIFCSIHSVTSFIHTAITAFAKLRKSI
jgi:hypothetical protein